MTEEAKRESLADAFAPARNGTKPARSEGLASLLGAGRAAKRPSGSTKETAVAFDAAPATPDVVVEAPRVPPAVRKKSKPTPVASSFSSGGVGTRAVYLRPGLLEQLRRYKRVAGLTYAEILVEAFDSVDDAQLFDAFVARPQTSKSGMPLAAPAPRGAEGIQINLRLNAAQVEWLNGKEELVGAPSRSALVAKVYELFFATRSA